MTLPSLAASLALLSASMAFAPFQCVGDPDPKKATFEEPGEALYELAEQFKGQGNEAARLETLRYLVARYPSSRFAGMAKDDLAKAPGRGE